MSVFIAPAPLTFRGNDDVSELTIVQPEKRTYLLDIGPPGVGPYERA
jgi:hypothetical protein